VRIKHLDALKLFIETVVNAVVWQVVRRQTNEIGGI
jgi:hypothetical protein